MGLCFILQKQPFSVSVVLHLLAVAAFDCIDHEIMISRLQYTFGVTDLALGWFASYFAARYRCLYADAASRLRRPLATTVSRRDPPLDLCALTYTWPLCHV